MCGDKNGKLEFLSFIISSICLFAYLFICKIIYLFWKMHWLLESSVWEIEITWIPQNQIVCSAFPVGTKPTPPTTTSTPKRILSLSRHYFSHLHPTWRPSHLCYESIITWPCCYCTSSKKVESDICYSKYVSDEHEIKKKKRNKKTPVCVFTQDK